MLKQIKLKNSVKAWQAPDPVTLVSAQHCDTKLLCQIVWNQLSVYLSTHSRREKHKNNVSPGVSQLDKDKSEASITEWWSSALIMCGCLVLLRVRLCSDETGQWLQAVPSDSKGLLIQSPSKWLRGRRRVLIPAWHLVLKMVPVHECTNSTGRNHVWVNWFKGSWRLLNHMNENYEVSMGCDEWNGCSFTDARISNLWMREKQWIMVWNHRIWVVDKEEGLNLLTPHTWDTLYSKSI